MFLQFNEAERWTWLVGGLQISVMFFWGVQEGAINLKHVFLSLRYRAPPAGGSKYRSSIFFDTKLLLDTNCDQFLLFLLSLLVTIM